MSIVHVKVIDTVVQSRFAAGTSPSIAATSYVTLGFGSLTGVRITAGPNFDRAQGAEYATLRHFTFSAEAEYVYRNSNGLLLDFTETLSITPPGPLYVCKNAINGPAQRQLVYPLMPCKATQSGSATGYRQYPEALARVLAWPFALKKPAPLVRTNPERKGTGYQGYKISWNYEYEYPTILAGIPRLWII